MIDKYPYNCPNECNLEIEGTKVKFSTMDKHSKRWFYSKKDGTPKLHEAPLTYMLLDLLKPNDAFIDVGAHLGFFTCLVGKKIPEGKVYSFEIDVIANQFIRKNVELNNLENVKLYKMGIADKKCTVKIDKTNAPKPWCRIITEEEEGQVYRDVECIDLDSFCKSFENKEIHPTVIKIDVEGAEMRVLKGMSDLLSKEDLVLFLEVHGNQLEHFNTNSEEIISFLEDKGYKIFEFKRHSCRKWGIKAELREINKEEKLGANTMVYAYKKGGRQDGK